MAGDWIKMRVDLYRDPKVCALADALMKTDGDLARYINQNTQRDMNVTRNVMRNVAVGALLSVWGVMRSRGKRIDDDLVCRGVTALVIDDITEVQGFGAAMLSVGWVEEIDGAIVFPRFFEEHNTDPTESAKQKNAERQRRFREKKQAEKSNVTDNVIITPREEKRREENILNNNAQTLPEKRTSIATRFDKFWAAYPLKKSKGQAEKAFSKINPDEPMLETMIQAIRKQVLHRQQLQAAGQFVPELKHPSTWLNAKAWEDELESVQPKAVGTHLSLVGSASPALPAFPFED